MCSVCVIFEPPPLFLFLSCQAFNSETDNFKLLYGGHQYHASCANFWINCVEPKPPGLILPDLLWVWSAAGAAGWRRSGWGSGRGHGELSDAHSHFTKDVENHWVVPFSIYCSPFYIPTMFGRIKPPQSESFSDEEPAALLSLPSGGFVLWTPRKKCVKVRRLFSLFMILNLPSKSDFWNMLCMYFVFLDPFPLKQSPWL